MKDTKGSTVLCLFQAGWGLCPSQTVRKEQDQESNPGRLPPESHPLTGLFSGREIGGTPTPTQHLTPCARTEAQCFIQVLVECSDSAIEIGRSHGNQRRSGLPPNTQQREKQESQNSHSGLSDPKVYAPSNISFQANCQRQILVYFSLLERLCH